MPLSFQIVGRFVTPAVPARVWTRSPEELGAGKSGAGDGDRTHDLMLGKHTL